MFNFFFLQSVYFCPTFVGFSFEMKEDMTITWTITPLDQFLTIADTRCILNSNFRSRMSKYDTIYTTYRLYTLKCLTENVTTCTFFVSNRWTTLCSVSAHAVCKWNIGPTYAMSEATDQQKIQRSSKYESVSWEA